ncbi:MAG: hypothetical protein WBW04_16535 [Nitrolancea sp.]
MAETHPVRLSPFEIRRQAIEFFGEFGLGMTITLDEPTHQRFENPDGFVELTARPDSDRQVRLMIDHHNCDEAIHEFKRQLAHEAEPGRGALPGEHHLPEERTH